MAWLPEIPAQKFSILSGSREEEIAIRVKAKVGDTPLVASQQGKRRTIIPGIQAYGAAVGATGIEGLGWTEGYTGDDTALALLFGKCGSHLTVSARSGCGKDTHSPVEATEELGTIRGETERVGCCQLILGAREGWRQACKVSVVCQGGGLGHGEHRAGQDREVSTRWL